MGTIRLHQTVVAVVLMLIFVAMAIEATTFRQVAGYFPLYTSITGAVIALLVVITGALRARKERVDVHAAEEVDADDVEDDDYEALLSAASAAELLRQKEQDDIRTFYAGLKWFSLFLAYVFGVWLLGLVAGSAVFMLVWFRTVHRWGVVPIGLSLMGLGVALWLAHNVVDMGFPSGWLFSVT